jgi:hypothetical protein
MKTVPWLGEVKSRSSRLGDMGTPGFLDESVKPVLLLQNQ